MDLASQLVLRAGHLPACGEGAEFPWDCTCDYGGFMEAMGVVFDVVAAARTYRADRTGFNRDRLGRALARLDAAS